MAIQYYMQYMVVISDAAVYALALTMTNSIGLLALPPRSAASALGIPFPYPTGNTSILPAYIVFFSPYDPGANIGFPNPSGVLVDDTILTMPIVSNQGGVPASIWPVDHNKDGIFTWSGVIMQSAGAGSSVSPPVPSLSNIPQRLGIGGREMVGSDSIQLEGGTWTLPSLTSRDASRTLDGFGMMIRGSNNTISWSRTPNAFRALTAQDKLWDRFYFRVRRLPNLVSLGMWRVHGSGAFAIGAGIRLMLDGSVRQFSIDGANVETQTGIMIASVVLNQWYKVDVLVRTSNVGLDNGNVNSYVNGSLVVSARMGGVAGVTYASIELGKYFSAVDNEGEIDLDDWVTSDWPANFTLFGAVPNITIIDSGNSSIDWLTGSHVRVHKSTAVSQVNWNPAAGGRIINSEGNPQNRVGTVEVTSITSGATLEGLTDAPLLNDLAGVEASIGVASVEVGLVSKSNVGVLTGRLGYKIAGVGPTTVAVSEAVTDSTLTAAYQPILGAVPTEISPLSVDKIKSTDANTTTVSFMEAVAEYIGVWGPEDAPQFVFPTTRNNLHNCRYFGSIYSGIGSRPLASCYSVGGTYNGNGTYQEITLPTACHFLLIRSITTPASGVKFFGCSNGPHNGVTDAIVTNLRMFFDNPSGLYKFAVGGAAGSVVNINAEVYQYIAFCDPGMRFNICGAFAHANSSSTPKINSLVDATFLADCGFGQAESYSNSGSLGLWFRGPGNTGANSATATDASAVENNFGNFAAGIFNSFAKLHAGNGAANTNYSLWRMKDSGTDATSIMIQVLQYTGNGAASQVITLTPTSNRFPVFVAVFPNNATASFYRDPSHTAANSSTFTNSGNVINGITAVAKDQITVGSALNTNGITFTVFSICGDTAGMNNGTFQANFNPGPAANYLAPQVNTGISVIGNGGLILDGVTALGILKNISGIYQLVLNSTHDVLQDTQVGQPTVNVKIPDPTFKTGYIGG